MDLSSRYIDPVALRENRVFETVDVEHTRESISAVLQPHRLTPMTGWEPTPCYLDHVPIGDMGIGAIRFGKMQVHVPELADYHLFIMCIAGHADARVQQQDYRIDRRHGLIVAPGEQMLASFSSGCEQLFVRIGKRSIGEHSAYERLQFHRAVDLGDRRISPWVQQLATIVSDPQTCGLMRSRPDIARDYERLLLNLLLAGQGHRDVASRGCAIAPGSVKRAEEFIRARFTDPLSLADIARASGVPARTLLESFRRFRDTSPIRYLRDVRLDHARRALADGTVKTAAEAAMEAGLMHLGRFSHEYAERFGEKPSDTLRRFRARR